MLAFDQAVWLFLFITTLLLHNGDENV
jgi:hypothetical protein